MSIKIMTAVWDIDLDASQKIVLLALADAANDEGHCWPGIASLAKKCSKSERTIQAMLLALEAAGHLTRNQVPGRGCNYYIHPRNSCTPAKSAPPQNLREPPQNLRPTPAKSAPKPSKNHQEPSLDASHPEGAQASAKPRLSKSRKVKPVIPDWMPMEAWDGYVAMRDRIRKPMTERAKELMIAKLDRWRADGHDPGAILDDATEHSWTGLYPPKEDRNAANRNNYGSRPSGRPEPDFSGPASGFARRAAAARSRESAGASDEPDACPARGDRGGTLAPARTLL